MPLFRSGRYNEAIAHLKEAVRLQPAYPDAHLGLARLSLAEGAPAAALADRLTSLAARAEGLPDVLEAARDTLVGVAGRPGERDGHIFHSALVEVEADDRLEPFALERGTRVLGIVPGIRQRLGVL